MTQATLNRRVLRLLVATLKGGPAKTTTAIMLAFALARRGYKVVLIDADTRTQGTTDWYNLMIDRGYTLPANLSILQWRSNDLDGKLSRFAKTAETVNEADIVIIDTGGEAPDVVQSALLYADRLLSPIGAKTGELRRMYATVDAAAEISENSHPVLMSALLTRIHHLSLGRGKAKAAREFLDGTLRRQELADGVAEEECEGLEVFVQATEIPLLEDVYGEVWGTLPDNLGKYDELATEIENEWKGAVAA